MRTRTFAIMAASVGVFATVAIVVVSGVVANQIRTNADAIITPMFYVTLYLNGSSVANTQCGNYLETGENQPGTYGNGPWIIYGTGTIYDKACGSCKHTTSPDGTTMIEVATVHTGVASYNAIVSVKSGYIITQISHAPVGHGGLNMKYSTAGVGSTTASISVTDAFAQSNGLAVYIAEGFAPEEPDCQCPCIGCA